MVRAGLERMFTGDGGTLTYMLLVFLASFMYIGRLFFSRRKYRNSRLAGICSGFVLLFTSRLVYVYPNTAQNMTWALFSLVAGLAGLYLIFMAVIAGGGPDRSCFWRVKVVLSGGLAGAILGGAITAVIAGRYAGEAPLPLIYAFTSFVPAGFLFGSFMERDPAGRAGTLVIGVSGGFLVAASGLEGLSILGVTGGNFFWRQLFCLVDLSGFFLLLVSSGMERGSGSGKTGGSAREKPLPLDSGDCPIPGLEECNLCIGRIVSISQMITDDANSDEIYREIVSTIADETGACITILRIESDTDDFFEARAFSGREKYHRDLGRELSVPRDMLLELCKSAREHREGCILRNDELGGEADSLVPADIRWENENILVYPVLGDGTIRGFFTVGFYPGEPEPYVAPILSVYAGKVLQVIRRERLREKLRERERTLSVYKEELDSVSQLKSNFMSIVSHELRTPLTSIKAYTETLLGSMENIQRDTIRDFLQVMDEENERLIKLVDNILNYSCMETGNLKVEKTSCNLNEMVEEVHRGLQEKYAEGNVNSDLRLPRKPAKIDADRELIKQLLQNLMSNAVKFTPSGGKVTVILEEEASAARIVVQDTGKGIPEDQLEKIFERFHQVDSSHTREHGGSGLGLAICKNIVDWHDGKIWVENVKEAGAKFVVRLPINDIIVRQASSTGFIGSIRFERERYLSLLVEMLAEFLQARKASIMIIDREQQILRIVAAKGLDPEFVQGTRIEVGDRIAGRVAKTGESLHVFDIERDVGFGRANNSSYYGSHSFLSVPVRDGGEIVGVLNVADHVEGREFTRMDKEILEALSGTIGGMLKKLDAYEMVSSNFKKLKDAMRAILDMREEWGSRNLTNLTMIVMAVGKRMSLDEQSLAALRLGMNLYDLGMMKVPRHIRAKKEELVEKEWEKLQRHTNIGFTMISPMSLEERIMKMVKSHHENFDGSGYPDGLVGGEIPVEARIINVVDTFRALITQGPYRRCYTIDEARNEIIKGAGSKFDPKVVGAFVKVLHELGAREVNGELVLDAVERELERERKARKKQGEKQQAGVPVKEGAL